MIARPTWLWTLLAAGPLAAALMAAGLGPPHRVLAHWGVCRNDPIVWLDNGAELQMGSSVQADQSLLSYIRFTVHVPIGTSVTRIQYTRGDDGTFESVQAVPDALFGYTVDEYAVSSSGVPYPVALSVHMVNQSSAWYSASGSTDQSVQALVLGP